MLFILDELIDARSKEPRPMRPDPPSREEVRARVPLANRPRYESDSSEEDDDDDRSTNHESDDDGIQATNYESDDEPEDHHNDQSNHTESDDDEPKDDDTDDRSINSDDRDEPIHRNNSNNNNDDTPPKFKSSYPSPKAVIYPNGPIDDNVEENIVNMLNDMADIRLALEIKGKKVAMERRLEKIMKERGEGGSSSEKVDIKLF
jgi:hypothetical protein